MVVPLIVGAAKVARKKSALRKSKRAGSATSAIAHQRSQQQTTKLAARSHSSEEDQTSEDRKKNIIQRIGNRLPQKKSSVGVSTSMRKKIKALNRGVLTLGSVLYPMIFQSISAAIVLIALAVEDSWWGWIDVIDASLTVASIFWILALILGTYTMIIAAFRMSMYLHNWKVVIAFIFCFSANWAPLLQIVPWVGIWIAYIIIHKK